jgi:ATP synthase protein I
MTTIPKPPVYRVALYQLSLLLLVCGVLLLFGDVRGWSVMTGGLIQIIPQAWFTRQAYRYTGARQVHLVVRAIYQGETGKVALTAALFVITFVVLKNLNFLVLMSTFIVMIPVQWFFTVRILNHR